MFASIKQNYTRVEENLNEFGFDMRPDHMFPGLNGFMDDTFGKLNNNANSDRLKLFFAAAKGNAQTVNSLLRRQVDVDARKSVAAGLAGALGNVFTYSTRDTYEPSYYLTPLHFAALNGHLEVVRLLISKKASVNARDENGIGAIHLASGSGHKEIVELLLEKGAYCNSCDTNGILPLHLAAEEGHMDITLVLIKNGAIFSSKTRKFSFNEKVGEFSSVSHEIDKWTPLHFAVSKKRFDIVKKLLRLEVIVENDYISPFHLAEKNCFLEMVKCLMSSGEQIEKDKLQLLFELAVAKQCSEGMTILNKKLGRNRC